MEANYNCCPEGQSHHPANFSIIPDSLLSVHSNRRTIHTLQQAESSKFEALIQKYTGGKHEKVGDILFLEMKEEL